MLHLSTLVHAIEIYENTHKSYLDKLIKLNNKLFRINPEELIGI